MQKRISNLPLSCSTSSLSNSNLSHSNSSSFDLPKPEPKNEMLISLVNRSQEKVNHNIACAISQRISFVFFPSEKEILQE